MACRRSSVRSRLAPPKSTVTRRFIFSRHWSPSSRGRGHRPFTAVTGVRIPLGTPVKSSRYLINSRAFGWLVWNASRIRYRLRRFVAAQFSGIGTSHLDRRLVMAYRSSMTSSRPITSTAATPAPSPNPKLAPSWAPGPLTPQEIESLRQSRKSDSEANLREFAVLFPKQRQNP